MQYLSNQFTGIAALLGAATLAGVLVAGLVAKAQPDEQTRDTTNQEKPPRAVVDTHELMELFNRPLLRFMKAELEKPEAERSWEGIADRGWQTAEVANLVALRNDDDQWIKFSADLQQSGIDLAKKAETKDFAATSQAYRKVIQKCNACHDALGGDHAPQLEP